MVTYKKYLTATGKERWSYHGYLGVNPKTGAYVKPRKKGFQSKAAAKLDYERQVQQLRQSKKLKPKKQVTFNQLATEYFSYYKDSGVKPGTYKKFTDEINKHARPILGAIYVDQIDIDDCQKTFDLLRKRRKDHRKIKNQIKAVLDFAITKR
ncbi:Arm DNA-binding domain-containing protein [Vagococcus salmoninarum]|nr:Arm DNA-binding domain-containing protein [Vagococcus salmoninarum]